jgi:hypothetical protein
MAALPQGCQITIIVEPSWGPSHTSAISPSAYESVAPSTGDSTSNRPGSATVDDGALTSAARFSATVTEV